MTNNDIAGYMRETWRYKILLARAARDNPPIMRDLLEQIYELTLRLQAFCQINDMDVKILFHNDNPFEEEGVTGWPSEYEGFLMTLGKPKEDAIRDLGEGYCTKTPQPFRLRYM